AGETVLTALARELAEEGNIVVAETPRLHGVFFNSRVSQRDHVVVFVVHGFRQDSLPEPNHEIIEHGFFALDALPKTTAPSTRRRIAEALQGAPIGDRW